MPIYSYRCPKCNAECDEIRCIADREQGPPCYRCSNNRMDLVVSPVAGVVKNPAVPRGSK